MKFKYMLRGFGIGILFSALVLAFSFYHEKQELGDAEIMARAAKLGMVKSSDVGEGLDKQALSEQLAEEAANRGQDAVSSGALEENGNQEAAATQDPADPPEDADQAGGDADRSTAQVISDEEYGQKAAGLEDGTADAGEKEGGAAGSAGKPAEPEKNEDGAAGTAGKPTAEQEKNEDGAAGTAGKPEPEKEETLVYHTLYVEPGSYSSDVAHNLVKLGIVADAYDFDQFMCVNDYAPKIQAGEFQIPAGASYEELARILTRQ